MLVLCLGVLTAEHSTTAQIGRLIFAKVEVRYISLQIIDCNLKMLTYVNVTKFGAIHRSIAHSALG